MGGGKGGGSSQTTGYKYLLDMHVIAILGVADVMNQITFDEKIAWSGVGLDGTTITVDAVELFGKMEGGVSGSIDICMGMPTQAVNSYLAGLHGEVPAFRGVSGFVMKQFYFGNNPYLKAPVFRMQRIHLTSFGETQWYDSKAAVPRPVEGIPPGGLLVPLSSTGWKYKQVPRSDTTDYSGASTSSWPVGMTPFGGADGGPGHTPPENTLWVTHTRMWIQRNVACSPGVNVDIRIPSSHDDTINVYWDGVAKFTQADGDADNLQHIITIPGSEVTGTHSLVIQAVDRTASGHPGPGEYCFIDVEVSQPGGGIDMNPSHIIRECLTDKDWGMGYNDDDIDDDSFAAAADTLYSEGMGISLLWDKQTPIEDFVKEILRHIAAALYVTRDTGKFKLKLIRKDYDEETLLVLDKSIVQGVENFSYNTFEELVNSVTINFFDNIANKPGSITVDDPALVQMQGAVINTTIHYQGFTNKLIADRVGLRDLLTLSSPLRSCTLYCNQGASELNIGDAFILDWPKFLGGSPMVFRVNGMALGDGKANRIRLNVVQDRFDFPDAGTTSGTDTEWTDPNQSPEAPEVHLAFEAPYYELVQRLGQTATDNLLTTTPESGFLLATGSRQVSAMNAEVWVDNGAGYEGKGVTDFSPLGTSTAAIPQEVGPSVLTLTNTFDLDLVEEDDLAFLEDEIVRVTSLSPVTVARGMLDTAIVSHPSGTKLIVWDRYANGPNEAYLDGESLDVKLLTRTGMGTLPIADAAVDTVVMDQRALRPYLPGNFQVNGEYFPTDAQTMPLVLTWAHRDRLQQTSGTFVEFTDGNVGPESGVTYVVRFYDGATLLREEPIASGTTYSYTSVEQTADGFVNPLGITVHAIRDGIESFQGQMTVVNFSGLGFGLGEALGEGA